MIKDVHKGTTIAQVEIELKGGQIMIASIMNESVDELGLAEGKKAYAVIICSDVMVAVEDPPASRSPMATSRV